MTEHSICPVSKAKKLNSWWRKMIHSPKRLLKKYIRKGNTVVDMGCGPGLFTLGIAKMIGKTGKIYAVDIQKEMLELTKEQINKTNISTPIEYILCNNSFPKIAEYVDFILAFFVVHELPSMSEFFKLAYQKLKPGGFCYIAEPIFHVNEKEFQDTLEIAKTTGFKLKEFPRVLLSRVVVFYK